MAGWEMERDEFIADRDKRQLRSDLSRVRTALGELGVGPEEVGVDFVVDAVKAMQPSRFYERNGEQSPVQRSIKEQGITSWLANRLVERQLNI